MKLNKIQSIEQLNKVKGLICISTDVSNVLLFFKLNDRQNY